MTQSLKLNLSLTKQDITKDWTFRDINIKLPIKNYDTTSKDIDAILNSINNMFMFNKGDRILLPEYGNSLNSIIYEPINELTVSRIDNEIRSMISAWEPRIIIDELLISPHEDQNQYHITVQYSIPELEGKKLKFTTLL